MFTGIIEKVGRIKNIKKLSKGAELIIDAEGLLKDVNVGDSIAVNGICLTATSVSDKTFSADVMAETLRRTSLGRLKAGDSVNLERAMPANGRFGGHIVSGHIDGTGTVSDLKKEDNAVWVTVKADEKILRLIVEKGSIAIDGISLTVAYVDDKCFKVSIIPHTGEATTLLGKKVGDSVNLENDIIGKYVERLLAFDKDRENNDNKDKTKTDDFSKMLLENGFM